MRSKFFRSPDFLLYCTTIVCSAVLCLISKGPSISGDGLLIGLAALTISLPTSPILFIVMIAVLKMGSLGNNVVNTIGFGTLILLYAIAFYQWFIFFQDSTLIRRIRRVLFLLSAFFAVLPFLLRIASFHNVIAPIGLQVISLFQ